MLACLMPFAMLAQSKVHYVKQGATGQGTSWNDAMGDLQKAIDLSSPGDEIWIGKGTYHPTKLINPKVKTSMAFILKDGITLRGGFDGEAVAEQRKTETVDGHAGKLFLNKTILSGELSGSEAQWSWQLAEGSSYRYEWKIEGNNKNATHVLYADPSKPLTQKVTIDGIVITGGNANQYKVYAGGAALIANGEVELTNCIIYHNNAHNKVEGRSFNGGAVTLLGGNGKSVVNNCYFYANQAFASYERSQGGSLYLEGGSVSNCTFIQSVSADGGGALALKGGKVTDCFFLNNYGSQGGAINAISNAKVDRCTIYFSRGLQGGGIFVQGGEVHHTLVAGCFADMIEMGDTRGGVGGGIYATGNAKLIGNLVYNCTAFIAGGVCADNAILYHSSVINNSVRNPNANSNVSLGDGKTPPTDHIKNCIWQADVATNNFINPTTFIGYGKTPDEQKAIQNANWGLCNSSKYVATGNAIEGINEETDLAGNRRNRNGKWDVGALAFTGGGADTPKEKAVITIENGKGAATHAILTIVAQGDVSIEGATGTFVNGQPVEYTYAPSSKTIVVKGNIKRFECSNNSITAISFAKCSQLSYVNVNDNLFLEKLDLSECPNLDSLYCMNNQLSQLTIGTAPKLKVLQCAGNKLTELELSSYTQLQSIFCFKNKLSKLNFYSGDVLQVLSCFSNQLTELPVLKGRKALRSIAINNNKLTSLDVSGCTALYQLMANNNKLATVKFKDNRQLSKLQLHFNQISQLDFTQVPNLTELYAYNNKLATIDLTPLTKLVKLSLFSNKISMIDLKPVTNLQELFLQDNQLSKLDVSMLPKLTTLNVGGNKLDVINLEQLPLLEYLFVNGNALTELDLSYNPQLKGLEVYENNLSSAAMSRMIQSLPKLEKMALLVICSESNERNVCNKRHVAWLNAKNWSARQLKMGLPKPYEGSDVDENTVMVQLIWDENGRISVNDPLIDLSQVAPNTTLTFTAIPLKRFELGSVFANDEDITTSLSYVVTDNTIVKAQFKKAEVAQSISTKSCVTTFPNPVLDVLHVEGEPNLAVMLYTMRGELLVRTVTNLQGNVSIPFGSYPQGNYVIVVGTEKHMVSKVL